MKFSQRRLRYLAGFLALSLPIFFIYQNFSPALTPGYHGALNYWSVQGFTRTTGGEIPSAGANQNPGKRLVLVTDLNGDGRSDLIWQDLRTDALEYWMMNGLQRTAKGALISQSTSQSVRTPLAAADLTGDGKPELLWQSSQREVYYWELSQPTNGTIQLAERKPNVLMKTATSQWRLAASADLNGDAYPDLVFQHVSSGEVFYSLMARSNTGEVKSLNAEYFPFSKAGNGLQNWRLVAVGDINGDRKIDMSWQNVFTGEVDYWMLNGYSYGGGGVIGRPGEAKWRLVSVADVTGDGAIDFVFQHSPIGMFFEDIPPLSTALASEVGRPIGTDSSGVTYYQVLNSNNCYDLYKGNVKIASCEFEFALSSEQNVILSRKSNGELISRSLDGQLCDGKQLVTFAGLFQNDMVLHDNGPRIWGTGRPGSVLKLSLKDRPGSNIAVQVDDQGKWKATLAGPNGAKIASGSTELVAINQCETKTLTGVKIGEVWLCSGQSNMWWSVAKSNERDAVSADVETTAVRDNLRFFMVPQTLSTTPLNQFPAPVGIDHKWLVPENANAQAFSSVCYHFGRELQKNLNKPIGLIGAAYGGSSIESWVPLADLPTKYRIDDYYDYRDSSTCFNAMISPLAGLKISGVAFYQGETNAVRPATYESILSVWKTSWRKHFSEPGLQFHLVQLADYGRAETVVPTGDVDLGGTSHWEELRQAQQESVQGDPTSGLATAIGTLTPYEKSINGALHPSVKKTVGERLARVALAKTYGLPETMPQWLPSRFTTTANGKIQVIFKLPSGIAAPAVGLNVPGFYFVIGSRLVYASSSKVIGVNALGEVAIDVAPPPVTGTIAEVRYQYHVAPQVGYVTSRGDPLYPLCIQPTGTSAWKPCDHSNQ